ncbi:MAG: phytoene desaturase family protein [Pyrinomonadaceae bacterium]
MQHDVIIIGAGHNGLVAAAYLAKAGLKTLVLERRGVAGGASVTEEIFPGFHCSVLAHAGGPFSPKVVAELNLNNFGLEFIEPEVRVVALSPESGPLCIYNDSEKAAREIKKFSATDAESYLQFVGSFSRIGSVLAPLTVMTPPSIDQPAAADVWNFGKLGLAFRGLGKRDEYRLLRWGPMAVADLAAEWFETELLRATVAARGIYGAFAGPWSAGTSLGLLWQAALGGHPIAPAQFVKGGMGKLTGALVGVLKQFGAELRTHVEVNRVETNGKGVRVVVSEGDELESRVVVSNADPRTTFLKLVDPMDLEPTFLSKVRNYRSVGTMLKINLALDRLPKFSGVAAEQLSGRIHVGPEIDYLERAFDQAKYGQFSTAPYLDITIPTLTDPSLAPSGKHVMSVCAQFAPYKLKQGDWKSRSDEFADGLLNLLEQYAPGIKQIVIARQVLTPGDLEETYGLDGGHIHHGEQSLDQFFTFRPFIGWARYRTPLKGLYLCGAGTHPGGGVTGLPGMNAAREILKDFKKHT